MEESIPDDQIHEMIGQNLSECPANPSHVTNYSHQLNLNLYLSRLSYPRDDIQETSFEQGDCTDTRVEKTH